MQATEPSKQEWKGYHNILQDPDFNFYLKVFSGYHYKPKSILKLCKQRVTTPIIVLKSGRFSEFFSMEKLISFNKVWTK
jgi:hypothetical protein